jgi:hypothetical protein
VFQVDILQLFIAVGSGENGLEPFVEKHGSPAEAFFHARRDAPYQLSLRARERKCHEKPWQ